CLTGMSTRSSSGNPIVHSAWSQPTACHSEGRGRGALPTWSSPDFHVSAGQVRRNNFPTRCVRSSRPSGQSSNGDGAAQLSGVTALFKLSACDWGVEGGGKGTTSTSRLPSPSADGVAFSSHPSLNHLVRQTERLTKPPERPTVSATHFW